MKNRRTFQRIDFAGSVQCAIDGDVFRGTVVDISEGGVRLRSDAVLPAQELIKLFMPMPAGESQQQLCYAEGRRVWFDDEEVGIEFTNTPPETLIAIAMMNTPQAA